VRVALPGAIINNTAELDQWLAGVRQQVEARLEDGPVIL
jgi:Tfp pilus assembly protein PilP